MTLSSPSNALIKRVGAAGVFAPLVLAAALYASPAFADLTLQATGTEAGSYSSNPLLATQGARALWGSTSEPDLLLKDTTPDSLVSLDAKIDQNIFNQSAFNSTDLHDTANLSTQNARWSASMVERTDYDTTRTSEMTVYGLNPLITRHTGLSVAPQATYSPTLSDTFGLSGAAANSSYANASFTNYETFAATPSYTHAFDPLNAGIFELQTQRFQTTNNINTRIDSAGPSIGWQTSFTPRLTGNAAIGMQTSREYVAGAPIDSWTWTYIFSGGLAFKGEQDTMNFNTARQQFPYGNGTEALQTSVGATWAHALNPMVALNLGGTYARSSYQGFNPGGIHDYASASIGAAYHVTERFDLTGTYQYRYETLTSTGTKPQDNSFVIGIACHPKLWTLQP